MTKEKENNLHLVEIVEIWQAISGYEGLYEVSSFGRVKSLLRYVNSGYNKKRLLLEIIMKPKLNKYGYLTICLWRNSMKKIVTIHRLVACTYLINDNNYPHINHIDGNKLNNHVDNLEFCTSLHNQRHAVSLGLRDNCTKYGEDCNFAKLKTEQVKYIRESYNKKTMNQKTLANKFNVSISTISMILSNKIWNGKRSEESRGERSSS